jgi:hypothetical protein
MSHEKNTRRVVMCKGTWPEDNYQDFVVFDVLPGESDADAIYRAGEAYSHNDEFYVTEKPNLEDRQ